MLYLKQVAAIAALCVPFAAASQSTPRYKSPAQAQAQLDKFCAPQNLATREGHHQCLQESSGQAMMFAEQFHALLFTHVGVAPKVENYHDMLKGWEKISIEFESVPDVNRIADYHKICYDTLQQNIFDPETPLSFSYTTGYNVPKGCVDRAARIAKTYNLPLDFAEATRLQTHFDKIYKYYKVNPVIPATKETPEHPAPQFAT